MGKTRNLFKKIRDTKGTVHERMGMEKKKKNRNGKDLTEVKEIKKRWGKKKYTKELYKRS